MSDLKTKNENKLPAIFLIPLLFCHAQSSTNHIMKFTDSDERGYREEVKLFADWCGTNNLVLKVKKTKEMMHAAHQWESCGDCCTCPGTCTPRPSWQRLKRAHLKSVHPDHFLQGHHRKCPHQQHQLSLWFVATTERKALRRVVRIAERTIGTTLPTTEELDRERHLTKCKRYHQRPPPTPATDSLLFSSQFYGPRL